MYKIYADDELIYDSTLEDYKIGKGSITLETNKSGSFTFSLYPEHFFYDKFVRLKTVITVYKSGKIVFRGRILNDVTDYSNNKVLTCEGELGFLQDSIIRPFTFNGTPETLFEKFIEEHNAQVDEFKRFKIGTVTVVDPNNYIARSNSEYESALSNLNSRLIEDSLGGYFYITHGEDGTDPIPTINYLADFTKISTQKIEFGSNLKNYTKTVKAEDIATVIIPLGHEVDDGDDSTENKKLTIASVNGDKDYVYSKDGVALYGWICKVVSWDDVTDASNLKSKAEAHLDSTIKQNITIELNAIDLHLLDKSIESFNVCDYIQVISAPHNFDSVLLCNKQTIDLLKPENDSIVLGYSYSTFTETNAKISQYVSNVTTIQKNINSISTQVVKIEKKTEDINKTLEELGLENTFKLIYPVGSIYMSVNNVNPGELFGGTWITWGAGKVPISVDKNDTDFNESEKIGGSKTHTHKNANSDGYQNGSLEASIGSGFGDANSIAFAESSKYADFYNNTYKVSGSSSEIGGTRSHNTKVVGETASGSTLQPYITCYMWKRTA